MSVRLVLLTVIFFLSTGVQAADTLSEAKPAAPQQGDTPALSDKMQALLDTIATPEKALEASRKYQENGQFGLARVVLQHGIKLAKASDTDHDELKNELEYAMPMLQAREQLVSGYPEQAEKILQQLTEKFSSDHRRSVEINALKGALGQSRVLAAARSNNERIVTNDVRNRLSQYYKKHKVFPGYSELNKIVPPGDKILQNYEIVYYQVARNAYRLVLRNLHNEENFLKIEATGLIK